MFGCGGLVGELLALEKVPGVSSSSSSISMGLLGWWWWLLLLLLLLKECLSFSEGSLAIGFDLLPLFFCQYHSEEWTDLK